MPRYTRGQVMEIAKAVRNTSMSDGARQTLTKYLAEIFRKDNPIFEERIFRDICNCKREDDLPQRKGVKKQNES